MAGSSATKAILSELAKRVPKNQLKQLYHFLDLHAKYNARVNKFPEKLPRIDWDYYRMNVRTEAIKMVDEFEKKYEELNKVFDDRSKLDTKKYYEELEKQRTEVQAQVKQYIAESNERIKAFENEIARLCYMKPYSEMTMEEFINLRPEHSHYIPHRRKPLFWPHDHEEQIPGLIGMEKPDLPRTGGGGGSVPFKPNHFKGTNEKAEFNAGEMQETKVEVKSAKGLPDPATAPTPEAKSMDAEASATQGESKCAAPGATVASPEHAKPKPVDDQVKASNPSTAEVNDPKIHKYEATPEEVKKKLDPCNIVEKLKKKEEATALIEEQSSTEKSTIGASSNTNEKINVKPTENKPEQQKKPHPCDLVKKPKETTAGKIDTCKTTTHVPSKDEKQEPRVKSEEQKPKEKKLTKEPPKELKKPHPCDLIKKKELKSSTKDTKKPQPCDEKNKTKTVAASDNKGPCKDRSKADVSPKKDEKTSADSCAPTPYYNPFRSEKENKELEEQACQENHQPDPCEGDKRSPKTEYYNPFKDSKKKK